MIIGVKLPKQLTCKDIGIYGIRCRTCTAPTWYVGQTKNPFSTRFSGHRKIWRSAEVDDAKIDDKAALVKHYAKKHPLEFESKLDFYKAWSVVFLDSPSNPAELDIYENRWFEKMGGSVNIQRMVLPTQK